MKSKYINIKIIIKYIVLILWMGIIFLFSNQKGTSSSGMSGNLVSFVLNITENITGIDCAYSIPVITLIVRKLAHFLIYFILGLLWISLLSEYNITINKIIIYSLLFCLLYACTDEIHQILIDGRNGNIFDVLIDMTGSFSSIYLYSLFNKA